MANFRMYNGMFVKVTGDMPPLEKGKVYQVLFQRGLGASTFCLIGVNAVFIVKDAGKWLEPVPPLKSGNAL